MWSLSLSDGKIKDSPKAERKARRISPKVLLRGTMNISEYWFQILARGTAVISEQVLCSLFKSAKAGWDPLNNQAHATTWSWVSPL